MFMLLSFVCLMIRPATNKQTKSVHACTVCVRLKKILPSYSKDRRALLVPFVLDEDIEGKGHAAFGMLLSSCT